MGIDLCAVLFGLSCFVFHNAVMLFLRGEKRSVRTL